MKIAFDRIGRSEHVSSIEVDDNATVFEIVDAIAKVAKRHLISKEFAVAVDFANGEVRIGDGRFGTGRMYLDD